MAVLESEYSNQVFGTREADLLAPAQVTGLAYTVEQGKVILTWAAVTTNSDTTAITDLAGYRVFRKNVAGDSYDLLGTTSDDEVTYTDTTAKDGSTHVYAVSAIDTADKPNEGEKSADLEVKTIPSIPSGLVASASVDGITLNWTSVKSDSDPKLNENLAGYNVYRSETDGKSYEKTGNVTATETTYSDTTAVAGTKYYYVITSVDNSN